MSVLAQIVKLIPGKLIETLAGKHQIQTRVFSATSHVVALLYAQLAHSLSLNDLCDSLQNHHGTLNRIRNCTPPSRNGLSYANRTRNVDFKHLNHLHGRGIFWVTRAELSVVF